jgi:1-acyl-sn-glycerol-3-phosphate acyltransferase
MKGGMMEFGRAIDGFQRQIDVSHQLKSAACDFRLLAAGVVRTYLRLYHRFEIKGRENLPNNGSFVMVANHTSHLDALCLLSALPFFQVDSTYPAAAQDYFCSGWRRLALGALAKTITFSRHEHIRQSLGQCRSLLSGPSNVLIFFPEGTRSTNDVIGPFRRGVGCLVRGTNIPVVPCAIHGALSAFPKGNVIPYPRALKLVIGRPRRYREMPPSRQSSHHIADDLRNAVGELLCS